MKISKKEIFMEYIEDYNFNRYVDYLSNVLKNPFIPSNILRDIYYKYGKKNIDIKFGIASNASTPKKIIKEIFNECFYERNNKRHLRNSHFNIVEAIASNPSVPVGIIEEINKLHDGYFKEDIVKNISIPRKIIEEALFGNKYEDYLIFDIVENKGIPHDILERIIKSKSFKNDIKHRIARRNDLTKKLKEILYKDNNSKMVNILASRKDAPSSFINKHSNHKSTLVRSTVAKNKKLKIENLERLSREKNKTILRNVAKNPKITHDIVVRIIKFKDKQIINALCRNPNVSESMKDMIYITTGVKSNGKKKKN